MYWHRIEANWEQFKGLVKERWAKLDEERLERSEGRRDQLLQAIVQCYDVTDEEAEKELSEWQRFQKLKPRAKPGPRRVAAT